VSILVTGASGSLGAEFARLIPTPLTPTSGELDIRDARRVDEFVAENAVDTVVHCAARTSVRQCEEDKSDAYAVNVSGTRAICDALARHSSAPRLLYVSTACVFPGDDSLAYYGEDDFPHPKNYYALTKLLAEYVVAGWAACRHDRQALIVRTNFAERGKWKHPRAFGDRYGTYLYPDQVAARAVELLDSQQTGLVHICGDRRLSMLEFARLTDDKVGAMSLEEYEGPAVTVNMSLTSVRIRPLKLAETTTQ
jgi:dTDP-4-dehydrorhamnose reductase